MSSRKFKYSLLLAIGLILLSFYLLCNSRWNNKNEPAMVVITDAKSTEKEDSLKEDQFEKYINEIDGEEISYPFSGHFVASDRIDSFEFDITDESFTIYLKGKRGTQVEYSDAVSIMPYREGDLNGDGLEDFGLLPGYKTSSCRIYFAYTIKNGHFKKIASTSTHLPDRMDGVDYFKRMGDSLRIITASETCCQCDGLDTTYVNLKSK